MEQYTFRTDEFREPPFESRQIHPLCELSPDALPRLNQSLGLDMSAAVFAAIQAVYRERELREPLVGEVRLLAILHSLTVPMPPVWAWARSVRTVMPWRRRGLT